MIVRHNTPCLYFRPLNASPVHFRRFLPHKFRAFSFPFLLGAASASIDAVTKSVRAPSAKTVITDIFSQSQILARAHHRVWEAPRDTFVHSDLWDRDGIRSVQKAVHFVPVP